MAFLRDETFKVCTWDVDQSDKLKMSSAFNFCQEVAGNHARTLGVGAEVLREKGFAWVLSRMSLSLGERPGWGSSVVARTWPRGKDRLFAIRDYQLMTPEGRVFASGRSAWILLNTASLRPHRVEALGLEIPDNPGMDALPDGAKSVEARTQLVARGDRRAGYSDIDYNGHVNNARYVQWVQDIVPLQALLGAPSMRLDINYLAEVRPDDRVLLSMVELKNDTPSGFYAEGSLAEGSAPCFRARLSLA